LQAQDHKPPAANSDDTAHARQLFEAGVTDYDAGNYSEALAHFQEAYRLKPHPLVRVNIANCYDKLGQPALAMQHFEAFLASGEGSPAQRDEVQTALGTLQKRVGRVALTVVPDGAQIVVDEHDERYAPLTEPILLTMGSHRLSIAHAGYLSEQRVLDVKPNETEQLHIELTSSPNTEPEPVAEAVAPVAAPPPAATPIAPEPAMIASAPPPSAAGEAGRGLPTSIWLVGGATFAIGIAAIVTGQLALAASREFDSNLASVRDPSLNEFQRSGAWSRGVDAANRADALAATTDILLAITLLGAGLTTYLAISDYESQPLVAVSFANHGGRLQLHGRF
jgi:hypothetical protein